jgi:hypothetical protein
MTVTIEEMRAAVHMTHACDATNLVCSERTIVRHSDRQETIDVHLFDIKGHARASQCYVWVDVVDLELIVIPVVLRTERISSAGKAVRTYRRKPLRKLSA